MMNGNAHVQCVCASSFMKFLSWIPSIGFFLHVLNTMSHIIIHFILWSYCMVLFVLLYVCGVFDISKKFLLHDFNFYHFPWLVSAFMSTWHFGLLKACLEYAFFLLVSPFMSKWHFSPLNTFFPFFIFKGRSGLMSSKTPMWQVKPKQYYPIFCCM